MRLFLFAALIRLLRFRVSSSCLRLYIGLGTQHTAPERELIRGMIRRSFGISFNRSHAERFRHCCRCYLRAHQVEQQQQDLKVADVIELHDACGCVRRCNINYMIIAFLRFATKKCRVVAAIVRINACLSYHNELQYCGCLMQGCAYASVKKVVLMHAHAFRIGNVRTVARHKARVTKQRYVGARAKIAQEKRCRSGLVVMNLF